MDLAKRDLTIHMNGRTFLIRSYHDGNDTNGPQWHAMIVESKTPLNYDRAPESSAAASIAEAVRYLVSFVEAPTAVSAAYSQGNRS